MKRKNWLDLLDEDLTVMVTRGWMIGSIILITISILFSDLAIGIVAGAGLFCQIVLWFLFEVFLRIRQLRHEERILKAIASLKPVAFPKLVIEIKSAAGEGNEN
ncbi:MAG TPA: hypothetical protein DEB25_06375 [Desulfobulbaceae bacterium]|nr:hypothetical protein [Desulfobulbaceae bacterium]